MQEPPSAPASRQFPGAPVILVSIDTLRSDHLPAYGYRDVATPAIDAVRADSVLFERAYCHSPLTLPSHLSMLTGLLPQDHGVRNNVGYRLPDGVTTVQGVLRDRGYATAAAVSAWVLRASTGIATGFDHYDDVLPTEEGAAMGSVQRVGEETARAALEWLGRRSETPFFFLLHLFEPHSPYEPTEPFAGRYPLAYDGEIATADHVLGRFLDRLRELGVYERALLVLTSDHGEGLGEHGEDEHGVFLYRHSLQVPLMIKLPGGLRAGETVTAPVQLVDLAPTVLSAVGAPVPLGLPGADILHPGFGQGAPRTLLAETLYPRIHLGWSPLASAVEGSLHYILAPRPELYDLQNDPGETHDLVESRVASAERLRSVVEEQWDPTGGPGQVTTEQAAALRALGYVGTSGAEDAGGSLADPKDRIHEIAWLRDAARAAEAGRHEDAITGFRRVLDSNPDLTDAWLQLARACEDAGRLEQAATAYAEAMARAPSLVGETSLAAARVMVRMERLDEARGLARQAEDLRPGAAHLLLADIALARGDATAAAEHARRASTVASTRLAARVLLARALATGGPDGAGRALEILDDVQRQAAADGRLPLRGLAFARGDALARLDRMDAAASAFEQEIRDFPRHRRAYTSLAVVHLLRRQPNMVRTTLEAMLAANPDPSAYRLAARTAAELGDEERAAAWRRRAELTAAPPE